MALASLFILELAANCSFAQDRPRFKFKELDIPLHNNEVTSIIEDRHGYLWVSTLIGLHKFDGQNLEFFASSEDSTSLPDPRVECMLEDSQGDLWIGTWDGLCKYNRQKNSFVRYDLIKGEKGTFKAREHVTSLVEDSEGVIWLSLSSQGLFHKDSRDADFQPFHQKLEVENITAMHIQDDSIFWIGTQGEGILRINQKTDLLQRFDYRKDGNQMQLVNDLITDNNGDLYISSEYVLGRIRSGTDRIERFDLEKKAYGRMIIDSKDRLWVAVENGGLLLYNKAKDDFFNYKHNLDDPYSAPSISYWHIFEDSQQRIWLGSTLDGLSMIDDFLYKFELYNTETAVGSGLNNNIIRFIHEDDAGNLYLATDGGGLNYFDRKRSVYKSWMYDAQNPESITSDAVLAMVEDMDGKLWIGTWQGGVNIFDPKTEKFERFMPEEEGLDRTIIVMKARNNDMWMGTNHGGLHRYENSTGQLHSYHFDPNDDNSLPMESIYALFEDSKGNIWAGSAGFGLALLKKELIEEGKFQRFQTTDKDSTSIPGKQISQIHEDKYGTIWVATSDGLAKYLPESQSFKNYNDSHGLAARYLKAIIEDEYGKFWITTEDGLSVFDPKTERFTNYDAVDGLQDKEFSRFCGVKLKTGEVAVGGINGFNIFDPEIIRDNPFAPKIYMSGLKVFNKDVIIDDKSGILDQHISLIPEIKLNHNQSIFSLEYIGISYNHPEQNQYAYRLRGLEEDWNYVGNKRTATYTNLNPGTYQFQVKGANHDDVWNDEGAVLDIVILPPWWKTWWAYTAMGIFMAFLITMFIRVRYHYLHTSQKKLTRLVNERTQQLEEKNTKIEMQAEELQTYVDQLHDLNIRLNQTNEDLEEKVNLRTRELVERNAKLADFAFINAHNLRAPVANIKGLIQLFEVKRSKEEVAQFIEMLKGQSDNLDKILKEIQEMLDHDHSLKEVQEKVEAKIMKAETGYPDID